MDTPVGAEGLPLLRGERSAGRVVQDVVVAVALWVVLGSLAGGLLALAGAWEPLAAVAVLVPLLGLAWWTARRLRAPALPVWVAGALALIALATTVWAGTTHAEQVLPRRDSGSYLQSAIDLAAHHERPIRVNVEQLGGPDVLRREGITLASPAFYQTGTADDPTIQPQFLVGPSVWWSVAIWCGGVPAAFWAPALAMGLAVLAIGLLAARTVGPRWGPPAAALVAVCFPVVHTARSTYSEPLALLVLSAALAALVPGVRAGATLSQERWAGWVTGALVGGGSLIRPDVLRESMLLVLVAGLALLQRRAYGRPLLVAVLVANIVGFALGMVTSYRYLGSISSDLVPLAVITILVVLGVLVVVRGAARGWRLPLIVRAWLPRVLPALVVLTGLVLASRPLWYVSYRSTPDSGSHYVAALQAQQGLTVDLGRNYAEESVVWMAWWVGPVTLVLALAALAVLTHRAAAAWTAERPLPSWTGPLLVATGSTVLTLIRPGITPDHPWADRRLLVALPFALVLAVAAIATVTRWGTRRLPSLATVGATVALAVGVAWPTVAATLPHAAQRVEQGELAAVRQVCRIAGPGDVALMVDSRAANEWPQVMRGMCDVPALSTTPALRSDPAALGVAVRAVSAAVEQHGGRLLLVAADSTRALDEVGATDILPVVDTTVREDPRLLEQRPSGLVDLPIQVWFGRVG